MLAGFPVVFKVSAKLAAGYDLLLGDSGLLGGKKPRTRLTPDSLGQAVIRTMAGFRVMGAGAAGLAATDGAFGNRTAAHGLGLSQITSDLANTGWNNGRSGHALSYGLYCRKIKIDKKALRLNPLLLDVHSFARRLLTDTDECGTLTMRPH